MTGGLLKERSSSVKLDTMGAHFVNRGLWHGPIRPSGVRNRCTKSRAHSSAGERSLHTGEVIGSIPIAPTILFLHED